MTSLEVLLADVREESGVRYPVMLRTGEYHIDEAGVQEWVHLLAYVQDDGVPVYTTGLRPPQVYKEAVR